MSTRTVQVSRDSFGLERKLQSILHVRGLMATLSAAPADGGFSTNFVTFLKMLRNSDKIS